MAAGEEMRISKIILMFCLFLLLAGIVSADAETDILLLNSDIAIEKYKIAQEEYKKTISYKVTEYTVEGFKGETSELYRVISRNPYRLIYCIGTKAYLTAIKYAPEKTILFSSIMNWRRLPEGDTVFGISNELHPMMHLMHFKNLFPDIKNIGVLYSREINEQWLALSKEAAEKVGINIIGEAVPDMDQTKESLEKILPEMDALWLIPDPMIISSRKNVISIIQACDRKKIPVFSYNHVYSKLGATLIIAVDDSTVGRQAAVMSDNILSGHLPKDNIQLPAGSNITVNLNKIKEFGIPYNHDALDTINHIFDATDIED
jgi:putative tryptophan/tyrosine transport system substrate-binding protein